MGNNNSTQDCQIYNTLFDEELYHGQLTGYKPPYNYIKDFNNFLNKYKSIVLQKKISIGISNDGIARNKNQINEFNTWLKKLDDCLYIKYGNYGSQLSQPSDETINKLGIKTLYDLQKSAYNERKVVLIQQGSGAKTGGKSKKSKSKSKKSKSKSKKSKKNKKH